MDEFVRINKYIAECTGLSRRDAEKYILDGLVKVNGKKITELSTKVKRSDKVAFKDKILKRSAYQYVLFNKPPGYITSRSDERGRKTIYDVLSKEHASLKPVGRLDKDTSGLLLLTDNGDLINSLTHPKFHLPKRYKVTVKGKLSMDEAYTFSQGIDIGNNEIASADVLSVILQPNNLYEVSMVLYQGYNRQIRRMFEKINCKVISLKRLSVGPLTLKTLKKGQYSKLKKKEVDTLLKYVDKKVKELEAKE